MFTPRGVLYNDNGFFKFWFKRLSGFFVPDNQTT